MIPQDTDCPRCHRMMSTDEGCEPTEYCHHCAQDILANATVLEEYSGKDGHRQWANHASVWLYPGDKIVVINTNSAR